MGKAKKTRKFAVAKTSCITDCVMGELERLGPKYEVALRLA